ncbi:neuropeptides capa receptor-like [Amphiura filiformis]|uniref:neuropeptides capa receptor-like n=1 Tax=Amphiura filiformis TaxID=82378 RepID=UPI003B225C47
MGSSTSNQCTPGYIYNITLPRMVDFFLYDETERIVITIVNPIIFSIGLIGNLAFLFVMFRIPRMRTVTNIYLTNLACADIIFLSIAILDKLSRYYISPIAGDQLCIGQAGCRSLYTVMNAAYYASLYLITMVALEKYYAICKPIQHRLFGSKERSYKFILAGWIGAFAFACALLPGYWELLVTCVTWPKFGGDFSHLPNVFALCASIDDWAIVYVNGLQAGPFIITLILNTIMYVLIIKKVRQQTQITPGNTTNNSRDLRRTKIRNQVTIMLVINGVVFFVCLAPFQITSFTSIITRPIGKYLLTDAQYEMLLHVARIMTYINSAVNPYVYTISNARYRQAFKDAFLGCCMSKSRRQFANETMTEETQARSSNTTNTSKM